MDDKGGKRMIEKMGRDAFKNSQRANQVVVQHTGFFILTYRKTQLTWKLLPLFVVQMKISHLWLICDFSKSWNIKQWKAKCFYRKMWSLLSGLLMIMPYLSMSGNWSAWSMYLNTSFDPFQFGIQRNFNKMLGIRHTLFYDYFYKKIKGKYFEVALSWVLSLCRIEASVPISSTL